MKLVVGVGEEIVGQVGVGPLGKASLVQVHEHSVLRFHHVAELTLHVAVCAEWLADVAAATVLGAQLDRLEPVHVLYCF